MFIMGILFSNGLYNIHNVHGINITYGLTHSIDDIFDFIFGIIFRNKCDNEKLYIDYSLWGYGEYYIYQTMHFVRIFSQDSKIKIINKTDILGFYTIFIFLFAKQNSLTNTLTLKL